MSKKKQSKKEMKKEMKIEVVCNGGQFYDPVTFEEIKPTDDMKVLFELDMTPEEMEKMMPSFRAFCRERNLDEAEMMKYVSLKAVPSTSDPTEPSTSGSCYKVYAEKNTAKKEEKPGSSKKK